MGLGLLFMTAFAAVFSTADCYSSSTRVYAYTSQDSRSVTASYYNSYEVIIQPGSYYYSSYYLEISWSSWNYDIPGNMPFCREAYMEVFLTSGYKSIGKFCSKNAGIPFKMYSRDGYAKIVLSTTGYGTSSAVTFYYQLKSKSSSPLGSSSSSSVCYNTNNYGSRGVIYSTGWPYNYKRSSDACNYRIQKLYGYGGIYVVFMDIKLYYSYYYYSGDCVQLYGSNYSSYYNNKAISSALCGTSNIETYSTYSKYLNIKFDRQNRPSYGSYPGFVAGYIMFRAPTAPTTSSPTTEPANNAVYETNASSFPVVAVVLGIVLPIVIIIIIVIAIVFCVKKRQRSTAWDADHIHRQSSNAVSVALPTTTQQTLQPATPPAYSNLAFSQPEQFYPTTSVQTALYPTVSHVYPTLQSYSTGQLSSAGNVPPQYSFMVAPAHSSIPSGALQPARASVIQAQRPAGALHPAPSLSSNSAGNAPLPPTSVEMSRDVPPPAYCDVAKI